MRGFQQCRRRWILNEMKCTGLLLGEILVVAKVVAEVPAAEVLHRQIKMFPILKRVNSIDDKRAGHFIEQQFLVDDWVHTFFHYYSKIETSLLRFGYFFHRVYLLWLFVLHFPYAPETPWANLVNEVVWISGGFLFWLLHHHRSWNGWILFSPEQGHVKVLFHQLFGGF